MDDHAPLATIKILDGDKLRNSKVVLTGLAAILLSCALPTGFAHEGMSEDEFVASAGKGTLGNPDLDEMDKIIDDIGSVQWSSVETIELLFDENYYDPAYIELTEGKSYRLIIKNVGEERHDIIGHDLFSALAIHEIRGDFGSIYTPHIDRITLSPGQQIEVRLSTVKAGAFPMVCTIGGHHDDGMEGDIVIKRR